MLLFWKGEAGGGEGERLVLRGREVEGVVGGAGWGAEGMGVGMWWWGVRGVFFRGRGRECRLEGF